MINSLKMVDCIPYRARVTVSTCVARQKKISRMVTDKQDIKSNCWGNNGDDLGTYMACVDCETGKRLFKESKTKKKESDIMTDVKMKTCEQCGEEYPADYQHFTKAPRAQDRLSKICRKCKFGLDDEVNKGADDMEKHFVGEVVDVNTKYAGTFEPTKDFKCQKCGGEYPLTKDYWHRKASNKTGFETTCKKCRNESKRKSNRNQDVLVIDFSDYKDLLETIRIEADVDLRTPEKQALFILREAVS